MMRVAIQGELGSFHHLAARHWFDESTEYIAADSFRAVFELVGSGRTDQAVIAIENSLFGSINEVYDLLAQSGFPVIGELSERIHQHLITLPGAKLQDITEVLSHPVALAQCTVFLDHYLPKAERVEYHDTAAAAEYIKQTGDPKLAAIGSSLAAELSDLSILKQSIENDHQNYTRFLVIAPGADSPANANKASLVIQTKNETGALYHALGVFADAGINMSKLQSRPIVGEVWHYQFYIDVEMAGEKLHQAVAALEAQDCTVTVLGEYKSAFKEYED